MISPLLFISKKCRIHLCNENKRFRETESCIYQDCDLYIEGHFKCYCKGCKLTARLAHLCLVPGKVGLKKPGTGEREGETGNGLDSTFPPTS